MIEFKGSYKKETEPKAISVLVQFDEDILHVWHLHDPFYRLVSSSHFSVSTSSGDSLGAITLSGGGFIETKDTGSLLRLKTEFENLDTKKSSFNNLELKDIFFFIMAFFIILMGIWLIAGDRFS